MALKLCEGFLNSFRALLDWLYVLFSLRFQFGDFACIMKCFSLLFRLSGIGIAKSNGY